MSARLAMVILFGAAACSACSGGDGNDPDARREFDAAPDAPEQGCTAMIQYTGELVDVDSTPMDFLGVFGADFTVRGQPQCTDETAPNGRFEMRVPAVDVIVDVNAPPPYFDGLAVVPTDVAMEMHSFRTFTVTRASELFSAFGLTVDDAAGHVLVYQALDHDTFMLTGVDGTAIATEDGVAWELGNAGRYILFLNVAAGTQTLSAGASNTLGVGPIPVEAGKISFVTTIFALD